MARPLPTVPDHLSPSRRVVWDAIEATMRERWEHTHLPDLGPKEVERAMLAPTRPMIGARETLARMMGRPVERGSGGRFDLPLDSDWTLEPDRPSYRDVTTGVWPTSTATTPLSTEPHWLVPPEGWQDHTDCADELKGDEDECALWIDPRTMAEFWALSTRGTEDALTLVGATADEATMLRKAWAVLMDSVDLVRWSRCWYTGRSTAGDCMIRHIEGRSFNKTVIEVLDGVHEGDEWAAMAAERDDGVVGWITGKDGKIIGYRVNWTGWLDAWVNASPVDRYCTAVSVAALIAHELTHVCRAPGHDDLEGAGECDEAYLTSSIMQYALYLKHPQAIRSTCCANNLRRFRRDGVEGAALFGNNGAHAAHIDNTCTTTISDGGITRSSKRPTDWPGPEWMPR